MNSKDYQILNGLVLHQTITEGQPPHPRADMISSIRTLREKYPDIEITGHPRNYFQTLFRMASKSGGFIRSLDAMPIKNGGLLLQSSWNEGGRPSQHFIIRKDLCLQTETYIDNNGEKVTAPVIAFRLPLWRRIIGGIFKPFKR